MEDEVKVDIPEKITVEIKEDHVSVKGALGTNTRKFNQHLMTLKKDSNSIVIEPAPEKHLNEKASNAAKAVAKEIRNDMKGVEEYYEIKMQTVFEHFPITVEIKPGIVNIKNMLGERDLRKAAIIGTTKIETKEQTLRIYGTSLDDVKQTALNIRSACKIRHRDDRTFQDGIYYALE
jgi:large subunit ribosomal protein L6